MFSQLLAFAILAVLCFEQELGISFLSKALVVGGKDYYPWTVRITLGGVMVLFDALLVLYFARIVRLHRRGLAAARPTLAGDLVMFAFVAVLCCGYLYGSIASASRLSLNMYQYMWIGRFFVLICDFFYITLEVGGVVLIGVFLRQLLRDKKLRDKTTGSRGLNDVR